MTLFRDPFGSLVALQAELDKLLSSPSPGFFASVSGAGVYPPLNVFRDKDELVVRAELPGVKADTIHVSVERRRLTIEGERVPERPRGAFHRRERVFGKFSRTVTLPDDVDVEKAAAQWKDGVLTLRIPPVAAAKPRQITVQAA